MAATIFKVNTSRLNSDAGNVHATATQINKQLAALQQRVTELDAMWDGPSHQAFHQAFMDDLTALSTMIANLEKLYQYEVNAKEKYETCENRVINEVNQI